MAVAMATLTVESRVDSKVSWKVDLMAAYLAKRIVGMLAVTWVEMLAHSTVFSKAVTWAE